MTGLTLGLLRPQYADRLAVADIGILFTFLAGAAVLMRRSGPRRFVAPFVWPIALVGVGGLLGSVHSGLTGPVVQRIGIDTASLLYIPLAAACMIWALDARVRALVASYSAGMAVSATATLLRVHPYGNRASGLFPNANVAGHYFATAFLVLILLPRVRLRLPLVILAATCVIATGSFGACAMALAGLCYWAVATKNARIGKVPFHRLVVPLVGLTAVLAVFGLFKDSIEASGVSAERMGRSGSIRQQAAVEALAIGLHHPTGVGPETIRLSRVLPGGVEIHNDVLGMFVERSIIAVLGLVLFVRQLWRKAKPGGVARALMVAFVLASCFRATLNYRHIGFALALALAYEHAPAISRPPGKRLVT